MKAFSAMLAILGVVSATLMEQPLEITPHPGAFSIYLNDTGMNNFIQPIIPLAFVFGLNNRTFNLDIHKSELLYSFDLTKLHLVEATGFDQKVFKYIDGTNRLHVVIGGVNASFTMDAALKALHFIPFEESAVNVTNLTLDFTLETTSDDQVHWKLADTSKITLDNVDIKMKNSFLDGLVKLCRGVIDLIIKD
jgi:hypothetical protein